MLGSFFAIFAGLVLLTGFMHTVPSLGPLLDRIGLALSRFKAVIGVVSFVLGLMGAIEVFNLLNMMLIIAGLMLLTDYLESIPSVGRWLDSFVKRLYAAQGAIGVLTLLVGILSLIP